MFEICLVFEMWGSQVLTEPSSHSDSCPCAGERCTRNTGNREQNLLSTYYSLVWWILLPPQFPFQPSPMKFEWNCSKV